MTRKPLNRLHPLRGGTIRNPWTRLRPSTVPTIQAWRWMRPRTVKGVK